jgi:hypothetical protein
MLGDNRDGSFDVVLRQVDYLVAFRTEDDGFCRVSGALDHASHKWMMALTGHTERMKMRSGANGRSIFSHLHMSNARFATDHPTAA